MTEKLVWGLFIITTIIIASIILLLGKIQPAGDIVEYYGSTVSLLSHGNVSLTDKDQKEIEKVLSPEYFKDPQYYIRGSDGKRYPVHFVFYSFLLLPARIFLNILQANPLLSFPVTNLIILTLTVYFIFKYYIRENIRRLQLLVLVYFSPLLFFITWPGPDLYVASFLLLALYSLFAKQYFITTMLVVLASWHSQPIGFIAIAVYIYYLYESIKPKIDAALIIQAVLLGILILLPYLYNYVQFGVWTPWVLIDNGWTKINGFGLQNIRIGKFLEQFLDPNIGLVWYAPVVFFIGFYTLVRLIKKEIHLLVCAIFFLFTALLYQTNPAWHYGTAGFGPSRHILFFLPFLIYLALRGLASFRYSGIKIILLILLGVWQIFSLDINGFLLPDFRNTLYHSPYAEYLLNNYPELYSPTSEIFIDRTNHTDFDYLTSAVYKNGELCKKAYILSDDVSKLITECNFIPKNNLNKTEGIYVNY